MSNAIDSRKDADSGATRADVVIVGAGPTGLLLAGDLAAAGVRTIVLERRPEQDENLTRAFAVHARTLEELDARGVADELVGRGQRVDGGQIFGGVQVSFSGLPSRFGYVLIVPQYETEGVLARRAEEQGARIVRGAGVREVRQDRDGVTVGTDDGREYRSTYLVGADGVHSAVRQQIGMPYPGEAVLRSVMLADVRLEHPPSLALAVNGGRDCFAFVVPFGDGWHRLIAWDRRRQLPDDAPVELAEVAAVARRARGDDLGIHDARWMSRFHSDERQVPRYRQGRVFLAGDAAHCHSPAGGLGMNTGMQDAANLGWKLAAAVRGEAPDWLLDSYHDERHPVGRAALRLSGGLVRAVTTRSAVVRWLRRELVSRMVRIDRVRERVTGQVSGVGLTYPAPRGSHPLVGRRMPDIALADGGEGAPTRLYEALRAGRFVLVAPANAAVPEGWEGRLLGVRPADPNHPVTLVRPDGYVAWAGVNANRLPEALTDWLGASSVGASLPGRAASSPR